MSAGVSFQVLYRGLQNQADVFFLFSYQLPPQGHFFQILPTIELHEMWNSRNIPSVFEVTALTFHHFKVSEGSHHHAPAYSPDFCFNPVKQLRNYNLAVVR